MLDTTFLDQLARFNLVIHKRVTSKYTGPRKSVSAGRGMTFKDHRIYSPGDDFRLIDWKVFARTDDLYIKNYEEERNLIVHVLVDYSASMDFGTPISKFDYASMLGVGFAYLAIRENEKFMFSTFSENLEVFQPKKGMSHLASMIEHLNSIKPAGNSKLVDTMLRYKKFIGSRALVFVISDFLLDIEEIKESLYSLKGQEVKVIQVLDPVEKDLKMEGDMVLKDSEDKSVMRTFITPRLRFKYQQKLEEHSALIEKACTQMGFDFHLITTNTPIFDAFYKVLY